MGLQIPFSVLPLPIHAFPLTTFKECQISYQHPPGTRLSALQIKVLTVPPFYLRFGDVQEVAQG